MKKSILAVLVVILAIFGGIMTVMSLAPVGQGEVGVVWTMKDGVQKETLSPGILYSPTAKMKKYPVSQQQLVFSNNPVIITKRNMLTGMWMPRQMAAW